MMVTVEDVNAVIHANMHPTENVMMVESVQTTIIVASAQTAKIATIRFHHRRLHNEQQGHRPMLVAMTHVTTMFEALRVWKKK